LTFSFIVLSRHAHYKKNLWGKRSEEYDEHPSNHIYFEKHCIK